MLAPLSRGYGILLGAFSDSRSVMPPDYYPWMSEFQQGWEQIRDELDQVLGECEVPALGDVMPGESRLSDNRWQVFMLRLWGRDIPENARRCPHTYELLRKHPEITSALFSILGPGKHIPAHRGPFRGVLRCHLGLHVPGPEGACRMRLDDRLYTWSEGGWLVFDDTFEHEVWNDCDRQRVVLFLDAKRLLPWPIRWLNDLTILFIGRIVMLGLADRQRAVAVPRTG